MLCEDEVLEQLEDELPSRGVCPSHIYSVNGAVELTN